MNVNDIMKYEQGEMTEKETISFFQGLINSGAAWQLQGHYGRIAAHFIEQGFCKPPDAWGLETSQQGENDGNME